VKVKVAASVIASIHKSDGSEALECVEVGRGETWSQIPRQMTDACVLTFLEQMQTVPRDGKFLERKKNVHSACVKTALIAPQGSI
jgi:hypothetical protein